MKKEIDLANKLAKAIALLQTNTRMSVEQKVFIVMDKVAPYELSVEDLQDILHLDRGAIAPAVEQWAKLGYMQDRGGQIARTP